MKSTEEQSAENQSAEDQSTDASKDSASARDAEHEGGRQGRTNTAVDDLSTGLRGLETADEDLADLLANNWKRVLGVLALSLLGVFLVNEYKSASMKRQFDASESYVNLQTAYSSILQEPLAPADGEEAAKKLAEARAQDEARLKENVHLIESIDSEGLLSRLAELYQAKHLIHEGNFEEAQGILAAATAAQESDSAVSDNAIIRDLAELIQARAAIAQGKLDDARSGLLALIQRGGIASIESAVVLASIADTEEQRSELETAVKNCNATHPELREQMQSELSQYGITFE